MNANLTTQSVRVQDHQDLGRVACRMGGGSEERSSYDTNDIRYRVSIQISQMSAVLNGADCRDCLQSVDLYCTLCLDRIDMPIQQGHIFPWVSLRLGARDPRVAVQDRVVRVGVYPIAANPIHWGHLAGGLSSMARLGLDKIIYIIAGSDPRKPALGSQRERHAIGKRLIEMFHPLFAYSPLARGNALTGEANLFRLLDLNRLQTMEVLYIAGTDHYRRNSPRTGQLDTIGRLEEGLQSLNAGDGKRRHRVAAAFLELQPPEKWIDSFFPIRLLPPLPFGFSSTSIRVSLADRRDPQGLTGLPFEAFNQINIRRLYSSTWPVGVCEGTLEVSCPITRKTAKETVVGCPDARRAPGAPERFRAAAPA